MFPPKWTMLKSQEPVNMLPAWQKELHKCDNEMGSILSY